MNQVTIAERKELTRLVEVLVLVERLGGDVEQHPAFPRARSLATRMLLDGYEGAEERRFDGLAPRFEP